MQARQTVTIDEKKLNSTKYSTMRKSVNIWMTSGILKNDGGGT